LEGYVSRFGHPDGQGDVEGFIKDGRELRNQIVAVLHGVPDVRPVDAHRIAQ